MITFYIMILLERVVLLIQKIW